MKRILQNSFSKTILCLLLALLTGGTVKADDELYKTALFGENYNSGPVTNYTSTWSATNNAFTVSLANFANASSFSILGYEVIWERWSYIACGSNSPATITTAATIDKPITKVAVTIDAISNVSRVNSIKLYTSADYATWTEAGTFDKSTGVKSVTLSSPAANHFYRIVVDCANGTENNVRISKVEYYKADESNTVATPVISGTQKFNPSTQVEISCGTTDAAIQYSLDGGTTWINYSDAFTIYATTTVKAKATKDDMTDSQVASRSFSHADDVEDVTWNLKAAPTGSTSATISTWTNDAEGNPTDAVMSLAKGGSSNNITAHLGQSDGTYFYNNQILMITPKDGYAIVSVEITVSGSSAGLTGNAWGNATASANGTKVTVTPEDGTAPVSVVCSAGTETNWQGQITEEHYTTITGVKVELAPISSPYIAVANDVVNATSAVTDGTIAVFYNDVNPNGAVVVVIDEEGNDVTWITARLDGDKNLTYTIAANTTLASRTAYMVVSVGDVHSHAVTVTQAAAYELANGGDNTELIQSHNGETCCVILNGRTFSTGKWYTLCLPFNVEIDNSPLVGAEACELDVNETQIDGKKLTLAFSDPVDELVAGTPYIIRWTSGNPIVNPVFENVEISSAMHNAECSLGDGRSITFKGSYSYQSFTAVDQSILFISSNKIYYVGEGTTIGAQRGYFQLDGLTYGTGTTSNGIKEFAITLIEDDPTGIENVNNNLNDNESIYNVAGQRIGKMQKGINIVNGKKIFVK